MITNFGCPWWHTKCLWDTFYADVIAPGNFSLDQVITVRSVSPDTVNNSFLSIPTPTINNDFILKRHMLVVARIHNLSW